DIAMATGISLAKVHLHLSELTAKGEIMSCHSIRFEKGKKIEGIRCRLELDIFRQQHRAGNRRFS
ncbi:MAG: hypothetical protein WB870_01700, partial [Gallionellaceae bacterium]